MKTMTIEQFEKLVSSSEWVREQDYEVIERMTVEVETGFDDEKAEFIKEDITRVWGWVTLTSTLGEMVITYNAGWSFDDHDKEGTLYTGTEGQSVVWEIDGVTIVDEDGDELSISDIADFIPWQFEDIKYDFIEFI